MVPGGPGTPGGLKSACHPNPCMNGGTCTENGGGYDCACVTQYSGPNCESKNHKYIFFNLKTFARLPLSKRKV